MKRYFFGFLLALFFLTLFAAIGARTDRQHRETVDAIAAGTLTPADSLQPHERAALETGQRLTNSIEHSSDLLQQVADRHRPKRQNTNAP